MSHVDPVRRCVSTPERSRPSFSCQLLCASLERSEKWAPPHGGYWWRCNDILKEVRRRDSRSHCFMMCSACSTLALIATGRHRRTQALHAGRCHWHLADLPTNRSALIAYFATQESLHQAVCECTCM